MPIIPKTMPFAGFPIYKVDEVKTLDDAKKIIKKMIKELDFMFRHMRDDMISSQNLVDDVDDDGGYLSLRKAYVVSISGTTATCYLDTNGVGSTVAVSCTVCGGSDLSMAFPRLVAGKIIYVSNDNGTWRCIHPFQTGEDC